MRRQLIRWPQRAVPALQRLFRPLQAIDVFIEDTNDEPFYRTLLNFAAQGSVKVARVYALGGRSAVLKAARSHQIGSSRALYIIDGDLAWVSGEPAPSLPILHRHEAYCIENLLICEKAIATVVSQDLAKTEEDAVALFDYAAWTAFIQPSLTDLFAVFATLRNFEPQEASVSIKVGTLCSGTPPILDLSKVNRALNNALLRAGSSGPLKTSVLSERQRILTRINSLGQPIYAVSGKNFLFPLLQLRLSSIGCKIKNKPLRMRLASCGDIGRFRHLVGALTRAARG